MRLHTVAIVLHLFICHVYSSKILGVFPTCAHSHFTIGFRLMEELAERGHQVTFISCFPQKKPIKNLKDVPVEGMAEAMEDIRAVLLDTENMSRFSITHLVNKMGMFTLEKTLTSPEVVKLLKTATFDVVLTEDFAVPGLLALATHFKAPSIVVASLRPSIWNNFYFGNPEEPAYLPLLHAPFTIPMNFYERLNNVFSFLYETINRHFVFLPKQNEMLHKYLPHLPDINEILYNHSLMLTNTHVSYDDVVPKLPNMIEIGGYHVAKPKPLPKDILDFLDKSPEGVVYFSLGSNLKSKDLAPEKIQAILNSLAKIKQKVIWKFEVDSMPNKPKNLFIGKWFPQNDVLAHPNVKAFISHGGMLGSIEAVYHGVPMIGIPFYGDQKSNILRAVRRGYALCVFYSELNEENFSNALYEILNNPKYAENVKHRSNLMKDRISSPMDTAIYWIEYVIRNGGAHFRSAALDLKWYQRAMLDVIFVVTAFIFGAIYIFRKTIKVFCRRKSKVSDTRKNK